MLALAAVSVRCWPLHERLRPRRVIDAEGVPVVVAAHELAELARGAPLALIVGVEDIAPRRHAHAAWAAESGALVGDGPIGRDAHRPAAPAWTTEGFLAKAPVQRDPG